MKNLKLIAFGIVLLISGATQAQVSLSVNIGTPPLWGPVGYTDARYYYLPDVEAYYDVPSSMFIYFDGGTWVHRRYLPRQYRGYDLYNGYKVVMTDYRGNAPYTYFSDYKVKYAKGYRGQAQKTIGVKPTKGNSGAKYNREARQVNKGGDRMNSKREGRSNEKNSKKDNGGGKGKKN